MNTGNKFLAALIVVQLILLATTRLLPADEADTAPGGDLLADYAAEQVSEITITDDQAQSLVLRKNSNGDWVLPNQGDYPVEALKVDSLLTALDGLQKNRLITESEANYRRLKVHEDEYLRRIEINGDYTLFVGTSGGGNATHTRLNGEEAVYLVGDLDLADASPAASAWVNTTYLSLTPTQVTQVTLQNANGTFAFTREGESWSLAGLAEGETLNVGGFENFLNQATMLRLTEPLGREALAEYGLETPQATLTVRVERPAATAPVEGTAEPDATATPTPEPEITDYIVLIGAELEDGVVVKSSESEYYVLMSASAAATFITQTRESFVLAPTPEPTAEVLPTLESPFETPEATPAATVEPTLEATTEAASEATAEATIEPTLEATVEATAEATEAP